MQVWPYQFTLESMRTALYERRVGDYDRFIVCRVDPNECVVVEGWCKPSLAEKARAILENHSREIGVWHSYVVFEFETRNISLIHSGQFGSK